MSACFCVFKAYSIFIFYSLLRKIIACNHVPFLKIFLNFVRFCPNFQKFCPFWTFLCPFAEKNAPLPLLSGIGPDVIQFHHICQSWSHLICSLHVLFIFFMIQRWYTFDKTCKNFQIKLRDGESPTSGTDEKFCWRFFIGWWESGDEWIWPFQFFLKLKKHSVNFEHRLILQPKLPVFTND